MFWSDSSAEANKIIEENMIESMINYSCDVSELSSKIDLNTASSEDLLTIPGVSNVFAASVIAYRHRVKFISNYNELSSLEGATPEILSAIRNNAQISSASNLEGYISSYLGYSPQTVALYHDSYHEIGIRNFQKFHAVYRRTSSAFSRLELNATTDKDPGENRYLDFYSVSLSVKDVLNFSSINIGDYTICLGNGILFSTPGNISKSAAPISPLFSRHAYLLRPYHSLSENGFLRGVAFEIPFGGLQLESPFKFTGFVSHRSLNAHVDSSDAVTSVDYSGLNLANSPSLKSLDEEIAGGILRFDSPHVVCGISAVRFGYNRAFADYYVQRSLVGEAFLRSQSESAAFSGEVLMDREVSFSANGGLDYKNIHFAIGLRDLRSHVIPDYAGVLSESFPVLPERGIYFGASFIPSKIVRIGCYYDHFVIRSNAGSPDRSGEEIFVDSYVNIGQIFDGATTLVYMRYRYKTKENFCIPESDFPISQAVSSAWKQNFRIDFRHKFSSTVTFRARFEKSFLLSSEKGELFLFDTNLTRDVLAMESRVCFYNTDSYNSAMYAVEDDLPGIGRYLLLYGDGARLAFAIKLKLKDVLSVGAKISRDIYNRYREMTIGSSSCSLSGVTYLSVEINWKFL
jgi:hypothetical protein